MKLEADSLHHELATKATGWGADLFGVADLEPAAEFIRDFYGPEWQRLSRAIAVGVFFPAAVVDQLTQGPTHTYLYYYKVINSRLDDIALRLTSLLAQHQWQAFPIPASQRVTADKLAGIFSHRLAGALAGLGWIGKSGSLITPEAGPRVRLVTVLTDAPLPIQQPLADRCGRCQACITACPAQALRGVHWQQTQSHLDQVDPGACHAYQDKVRVAFGKRVCGQCLAACPWGSSTVSRKRGEQDA